MENNGRCLIILFISNNLLSSSILSIFVLIPFISIHIFKACRAIHTSTYKISILYLHNLPNKYVPWTRTKRSTILFLLSKNVCMLGVVLSYIEVKLSTQIKVVRLLLDHFKDSYRFHRLEIEYYMGCTRIYGTYIPLCM